MRRRLVLLRHGRTSWNAAGRWQGQQDAPLDDVGRAQAEAVAPLVAAMEPVLLLTSDLSRAADTAAAVARATRLPVEPDVRLRERYAGAWEGRTREEIAVGWPQEWATFRDGGDEPFGGGETSAALAQRVGPAVLDASRRLTDGQTAVLVSHGAAARAGMAWLLGLPVEVAWRLAPLGNARWSVLVEDDRGWRLNQHGGGADPLPTPLPPAWAAASAPPPSPAPGSDAR